MRASTLKCHPSLSGDKTDAQLKTEKRARGSNRAPGLESRGCTLSLPANRTFVSQAGTAIAGGPKRHQPMDHWNKPTVEISTGKSRRQRIDYQNTKVSRVSTLSILPAWTPFGRVQPLTLPYLRGVHAVHADSVSIADAGARVHAHLTHDSCRNSVDSVDAPESQRRETLRVVKRCPRCRNGQRGHRGHPGGQTLGRWSV